jgi:hypothetical protein
MKLLAALLALAATPAVARAEPPSAPTAPGPSAPPASPPGPTASPPDAPDAAKAETQAAAALAASRDTEARMVEIQRQLDALAARQASWEDVRRRLDDIDARLQELAREAGAQPPPAPAMAPSPLRFRDGGIVISSPDHAFLMRPMLRVQALYQGVIASAGAGDMARPDASGFSIPHAQLGVAGHAFTPALGYRFQVDFAQTPILEDAFVQWDFGRSVGVRAGQFKVPYGLQRQYWTAMLELPDVSQATAAFAYQRDIGVMIVGHPLAGRLFYELAVQNGAGAGQPNDNLDLAYTARVVASPFGPLPSWEGDVEPHARPLLAFGVSGTYSLVPTDVRARTGDPQASVDVDGDGRVDNVAVWQGGVEMRALFHGAALQAEWFGRREDPGVAAPDRGFWGAYVQGSYFVLPRHLAVLGRVGHSDLPLYGATLAQHLSQGTAVDEQTGGLSAYLRGHWAKLQLEYTHLARHDALSAPNAHVLSAAAQLAF